MWGCSVATLSKASWFDYKKNCDNTERILIQFFPVIEYRIIEEYTMIFSRSQ
jgi:hypothetical protein